MKKLLHITLAIVSNLLICSFTLGNLGTGTVKGTVVDGNGKPIAYSNIILLKDGSMVQGTISDHHGGFNFDKVAIGSFDLNATSMGYVGRYVKGLQIHGGENELPPLVLNQGLFYSEFVCSADRPFCDKPCGYGCICECCVPAEEWVENDGQLNILIRSDTASYLALESWRSILPTDRR